MTDKILIHYEEMTNSELDFLKEIAAKGLSGVVFPAIFEKILISR
jgi:hypothetical protein